MTVKRMTAMAAVAGAAAIFAIGAWGAAEAETASGPVELSIMNFWEPNPEATSESMTMVWWGEATGTILHPINVDRTDYDTKLSTMLASRDMPDIISADLQHGTPRHPYDVRSLGSVRQHHRATGPGQHARAEAVRRPVSVHHGIRSRRQQLHAAPAQHVRRDNDAGRFLHEEGSPRTGRLGRGQDGRGDVHRTRIAGGVPNGVPGDQPGPRGSGAHDPQSRQSRVVRAAGCSGRFSRALARTTTSNFNQHDEYVFGPLTENFRIGLEFINVLYAEGILHPQWLTMPEEEQGQLDWRGHRNGVWLPSGAVSHYETGGGAARTPPRPPRATSSSRRSSTGSRRRTASEARAGVRGSSTRTPRTSRKR